MTRLFVVTQGCALALLMLASSSGIAADSVSFEFGTGDKVRLARVGAQWNWERKWWQSNGTHLGGYWDLSIARWRMGEYRSIRGNTKYLSAIGATPVFRLQRDDLKGWYGELGIGVRILSEDFDNADRQLSTRFQFSDHIGIGYVFGNGLDLGLKIQHYSNGSIRKPNDGVNFAILKTAYQF